MDRFAVNFRRRTTGTLMTSFGEWVSVGDLDDLTIRDAACGRHSIRPAATSAGTRIIVNAQGTAVADHAIETIVDRGYPYVAGDSLGVVIGWQVSICAEAATGYTGRSDSSDSADQSLAQLRCTPLEDLSIGRDNHLRVLVTSTAITLVERRGGVSTTVWSMAINALHKRIAIRAELVRGDLLIWWNPSGKLDFRDAPILRRNTLMSTAGRAGLICGRDGRFLDAAAVEYRVEAHRQPVAHVDVEQVEGALTPMRLSVAFDESRPPMETTIQIAEAADTRLPERFERMSRVRLRDMRAALRPGATYRATVWARTVDDELVVIRQPRPFVMPGTLLEDLQLRDDGGRLILPAEVEAPAGDVKSPLDYDSFPLDLAGPIRCEASAPDANMEITFGNRPHAQQTSVASVRAWNGELANITQSDRDLLVAFLAEHHGRTAPFLWEQPFTEEVILVRFGASDLSFTTGEADTFSCQVRLEEALPDDTEPLPGIGSTDSGGESGSLFTGDVCLSFVTGNGTWVLGNPTVMDLDLTKRCYLDTVLTVSHSHKIRLELVRFDSESADFEFKRGEEVLAEASIVEGGITLSVDPRAFPEQCGAGETTFPSLPVNACDATIDADYCGAKRFYNGQEALGDTAICGSDTPLARWYTVVGTVVSCLGGLPAKISTFKVEEVICTEGEFAGE